MGTSQGIAVSSFCLKNSNVVSLWYTAEDLSPFPWGPILADVDWKNSAPDAVLQLLAMPILYQILIQSTIRTKASGGCNECRLSLEAIDKVFNWRRVLYRGLIMKATPLLSSVICMDPGVRTSVEDCFLSL